MDDSLKIEALIEYALPHMDGSQRNQHPYTSYESISKEFYLALESIIQKQFFVWDHRTTTP